MQKTVSILVSGKVQAVFYRQSAKERAMALGITGTICNLPDGKVKIMATGDEKQLDTFIDWCKGGPPRAVVSTVEINESPPEDFEGFSIKRS